MTNSNPTVAKLDEAARRIAGRPLLECTAENLALVNRTLAAEVTAREAAIDQTRAAIADLERGCGCPLVVPPGPDGEPDAGRARVLHLPTCNARTNR